jgi:cellulose 1,4-beta-cellobiosidase
LALSCLPGRPAIGRRCLRDRPAARNLLAGAGHTQWPDGGKKLVKKALMLAFALAACLQTIPVSAARAATSAAGSTLCLKSQHLIVHNRFGTRFQIRNSYWRGQRRQCIHNSGDRDNFTITQRPGFDPAGRVVAFPHIFRGCAWKICSPNAGIPIKVSAIGHLVTTWHTRENAPGTWNAAYDIWFGKRRMTTGQPTGAELMIWLNHHGRCCALQHGAPKVWIDGRPFRLSHWIARHNGLSWHYIQFRMIHKTWHVDHLRLRPFIRRCVRLGLIRPWWWMENVEAGFELWSGGQGLATTRFGVSMP